ncbi:MAG TPA: energy-coupling factor transporter transmembrane component T [Roseiflexaceae bacterium]|nr:energy-coupling factor transporter transmembrane component T [Roseiflexaceae bacterium]
MLDRLALGVYYPGESLLHRLRARTKLLVLLWLIVFVTVANRQTDWRPTPYAGLVAVVIAAVLLSGISLGHLWRRVRLLALLTAIGALITALFLAEDDTPLLTAGPWRVPYALALAAALIVCAVLAIVLGLALLGLPAARRFWRRQSLRSRVGSAAAALLTAGLLWAPIGDLLIGPLVLTSGGARLGGRLYAVFLSLYTLALLLTMTTTPVALIEGLTMLLAPLRRLRLPIDEFALMALLALRFIPTLTEEIELLVKAQMARGADFTHGTLQERAQSLAALFVPLLQGALRRAAELATALDARGYAIEGQQTMLHEGALAVRDYAVMGAVVLMTVGALVME